MSGEITDVLIVGAGLSGIGMACHLARECPGKSVAILERRNAIGGTWDLFRYPGIRSDSDMFSFGYEFRPWNDLKVLADGPSIRSYIRDTAREYGIESKITFGFRTKNVDWSSREGCWTVTGTDEATGETLRRKARFVIGATGYYNYDTGFQPDFPGLDSFKGQLIHPQKWPEGLDYRGKRVVVVGSGATAVTLVPAMAGEAAHVTMLQRSPSYIFSVPALDKISGFLKTFLPESWVYGLARRRNITVQRWLYIAARRWPHLVRRWLLSNVRKAVGPDFDMSHFTPTYNPWDERLCAVPNADLFAALKSGQASVVTDQIESFTETGIRLKSGKLLEADIVVSATGLNVQMLGGTEVSLDGKTKSVASSMMYKGVLVQDMPNFACIFGYINAPWTLKADIASSYVCRLLNHMDRNGIKVATPRDLEGSALDDTIMGGLSSGYVRRARDTLPRQGRKLPWAVLHDYKRDKVMLLNDAIDDGNLEFAKG